jgi:hypothetical protein
MVLALDTERETILRQPQGRRYGYAQNICYALSSGIILNEAPRRVIPAAAC